MRLSAATSERLPASVAKPGYDWRAQRRGIVHLGVGAFHRAHQASYTDAAMAAGDRDWTITGVSLRSPQVRDAIGPQDGLFTLTERDEAGDRTRLIGALREVLVAPEYSQSVVHALADPGTHIVTLTVTEKGYCRLPDGTLDRAKAAAPESLYALLAAAFRSRMAAGIGGLTLVSCDNLAANGNVLASLMHAYLDRHAPAVLGWFERECACPVTMVDRIVPAMSADQLNSVAARLGMRDEGAVITEPFSQWVIADRFAGSRPRWEAAGAQFVSDVGPYEDAKLRMLNGAHSALAYLGLAAGHVYVHEAIADRAIRPLIERLMREEAAASLDPAPGQDLSLYADRLLRRFANTALPHRLAQIGTDGSQKIGQRWLTPLAINERRGHSCPATLQALAAWIVHMRGDVNPVDDPLRDEIAMLWKSAGCEGIVEALFGPGGLFAATWTASAPAATILRGHVKGATQQG